MAKEKKGSSKRNKKKIAELMAKLKGTKDDKKKRPLRLQLRALGHKGGLSKKK